MNYKRVLLIIVSISFSIGVNAQEIIRSKKLGELDRAAIKNLDEVNALVFKPDGYDTVMNPKLPDSLSSLMMLSKDELVEMHKKRFRFNPYLVFGNPVELKNGDILVGFSTSWIRLSSYYKYNNDSSSVEAYRKKANQNMLGTNMIGYSPNFKLLEDVKSTSRKLVNADTVFIYDTKQKYRFKDTVDNYGSLVVHLVKFDLGYVSLRYYYPLDNREMALSEINNTWGIIQFKPDREFTHPNYDGWIPPREEPDLYFGKFSFLNNPEQVKRENEQYEQRKLKSKANSLATEAVRLAQSKQFDQAKENFFEVLKIDSNNVITYRHLLLMSMDENNRNDSWRYWNKLMEKDPKNNETWFLKGLVEKKYNELDSATKTFEKILREKDSLHYKSFIELAFISTLKGDNDAADLNFNRAINIFKIEGEKSLRKESHRMFNINDLFRVRLAYAKFLNTNSAFEKSKMLFEQTLREEEVAIEAGKKGERQGIYGKLTPASLGELNFMLAMSYAGLKDELNARLYLEKARSLGKVLPEELDRF
ncbi:tetratricopeptide repeat protein [Parapedobacter sp. DT-150]|uniref:tetratricopeptide repeat protein n=1 Tax=Parapedobacter sp. DT-150 TaxID=3396162 RepID=UPI003F19E288